MEVVKEFIRALGVYAHHKQAVFEKVEHFIYDPRFNETWLIDHLRDQEAQGVDDQVWIEGVCYRHVFDQLVNECANKRMTPICSSDDIGEDCHSTGDYDYYMGIVDEVPYIFHATPSFYDAPDQVTFFDKLYTFRVDAGCKQIEIYQTVDGARTMFYLPSSLQRVQAIKYYLETSDRRLIYE